MKKVWCIFVVALLAIMAVTAGCSSPQNRDVLFQTSIIDALMAGVYDGNMTFGELKKHGDFGLGTFEALDGEMVALDGRFYQIKADGVAYVVNGVALTPFAVVTHFETDRIFMLDDSLNYQQLAQYLDGLLPTANIIYAIRMDGRFDYVKARSVHRQSKPYPTLSEALKNQTQFELRSVSGTMVGFRCPDYMKGINATGYHLHFLTADRKAGGHVLDCQTRDIRIQIDDTPDFYVDLIGSGEFNSLDLSQDRQPELKKVE